MVLLETFVNKIAAISILASHILLAVFLLFFVYVKFLKKELSPYWQEVWEFIEKNSLLFAFLMVTGGTFGSLVYSEILKLPPCDLCWLQRVFIYPQVIILGVALWKKQRDIFDYVIGLNVIGLVFAIYQYTMQMINYSGPCPIGFGTASCFTKDVFEFGYITIPLMSLTLMVFLIILTYISKQSGKREKVSKENIQRIEEE
ncbi:MAG: disulfide bond formation protein B [Candidatus Pacearchaeota archaeon]|jgi:disulfide bond formation protein DsbB